MHDKGRYNHLSQGRTSESRALLRLLDFAELHEIPITFNIVGHLLHESCSGYHPGPHYEGWWSEDPGTDSESNPLFYAPELVSEIQDRPVNHEIGTHTYSHFLANEAPTSALDDELSKVAEIHSEFGLPSPTSIVMPRHQNPDYSILANHGIQSIRRPIDGYSKQFRNPVSKAWWILTRAHPQSTIDSQEGILETTVTPHPSLTSGTLPAGQMPPHIAFSVIPTRTRQFFHRRYLVKAFELAATENHHIHVWTHLYNLANEFQWRPLRDGLVDLSQLKKQDKVEIRRMKELSNIV